MKPLGNATGDKSHEAFMPAVGADKDQRAHRIGGEESIGKGEGFLQHALLYSLALGVERVELRREVSRLEVVVGGEQFCAEARRADPAASIDTGAEDEAERVAGGGAVEAGDVGKRAQAGIVPEVQDLETLGNESAVDTLERHDVANRRKGHEIEQLEQVGLRTVAVEAVAAKHPRGGHQEQKDDARSGEMALAREIVLTVGVQHRVGRRQRFVCLMVVDDDDLGAGGIGRGDGCVRCRPAIDGQDERGPLAREPGKRRRGRSIAFGEPVGDVGRAAERMGAQEAFDQRH